MPRAWVAVPGVAAKTRCGSGGGGGQRQPRLLPPPGCPQRASEAAAQWRCGSSSGNAGEPTPAAAGSSTGPPPADAGASSGSGGGGGTSQASQQRSAWELMGRVWREDRVLAQLGGGHLQQGLVRSAAARESGLDYDAFDQRLQHLLTLMPFLTDRLPRLAPKLVAALAADPPAIAARLVELKGLLPAADVAKIAGGRPSLLVPPEWELVPAGVAALQARYTEEEVARLAAAEPLLLAEDVEAVLAELQRLLPGQQPAEALLRQPSLASSVSRLSHLSLWLAGGGDARAMLLGNPSLVYSVQRGTSALGPGAEFL